MLRIFRFVAVTLLVLLGGVWAYAWVTKAPDQDLADAFAERLAGLSTGQVQVPAAGGIVPQGPPLGGAFRLVDQSGRAVTEQDYAGRWRLVYFGYAYCPDVCPTELGAMAATLDAMGPAGEAVVPVFVTVDPDRDTPAALADYVSRFHPRMQGLTGTAEQVAEIARRYRVYYAKVQRPEMTSYLMDHSSFIYLVGPDARVRLLFRPEMKPEAMAAAVAAFIGGGRG